MFPVFASSMQLGDKRISNTKELRVRVSVCWRARQTCSELSGEGFKAAIDFPRAKNRC